MREVIDLLGRLRALGVSLTLDGDSLKCAAPAGVLTAELRAELTQNKPGILAFLRSSRNAAGAGEAVFSRVDRTGCSHSLMPSSVCGFCASSILRARSTTFRLP